MCSEWLTKGTGELKAYLLRSGSIVVYGDQLRCGGEQFGQLLLQRPRFAINLVQ